MLLIIGLNEKTGSVHPLSSTDPATWWTSFQARFDEAAPNLTVHLRVAVGDGEFVTALAFDTSRVPFLVKGRDGSAPHFEIPIRDGTTTRSAHRHEVLRLLGPTIALPAISFLNAHARVTWQAAVVAVQPSPTDRRQVQEERASLMARLAAYVEHLVPDFVMIPTHLIEARISFGD